jgi:hypothetical protein
VGRERAVFGDRRAPVKVKRREDGGREVLVLLGVYGDAWVCGGRGFSGSSLSSVGSSVDGCWNHESVEGSCGVFGK